MIPTDDLFAAAINADPRDLQALGWSEAALPIRKRVLETLHRWVSADPSRPASPPTYAELTPLVAVWESGTDAAEDAAVLIMMFEVGRSQFIAEQPPVTDGEG